MTNRLKEWISSSGLEKTIMDALKEGFIKIDELDLERYTPAFVFLEYFNEMKTNYELPEDKYELINRKAIIDFIKQKGKDKINKKTRKILEKAIKAKVDEDLLEEIETVINFIDKNSFLKDTEFRSNLKEAIISYSNNFYILKKCKEILRDINPAFWKEINAKIGESRTKVSKQSIPVKKIPLFKEAILKDDLRLWYCSNKKPEEISKEDFLELKDKWLKSKDRVLLAKIVRVPYFYEEVDVKEQARVIEEVLPSLSSVELRTVYNHLETLYPYLSWEACLQIFSAATFSYYEPSFEIKIPLKKLKEIVEFAVLKYPKEEQYQYFLKSINLLELLNNIKPLKDRSFLSKIISEFMKNYAMKWYEKLSALYEDFQSIPEEEKGKFLGIVRSKISMVWK